MRVLYFVFGVIGVVLCVEPPMVTLPNLGAIEGNHRKSLNGKTFFSFEGVPYAVAPVENRRFEAPTYVKPWVGVWKAKTIYKCIQWNQYTLPGQDFVTGEEDCLYLNIYSPKLKPDANLDVIVYIHGGAFMFNYGAYQGPEYLLDRDVVFITMNYRLGPLGFLSTENEALPGNNGLKDQIMALRFIKDHVKVFGGNPDSITIVGVSAGGASVHFHYLSPKSRGLFHKGWSMSGTTLNPWVLSENPLEKTKKLASGLGCGDSETMLKCLKKRPARQVVTEVKNFQPWLYNPFTPFGVVVDSWASDPVLPEHPYILLKKGKVYDIPWIASYTNSEGLYPVAEFLMDDEYIRDIDRRWNELIPFLLDYNYTVDPKLQDQVSQKIREHYLQDLEVTRSNCKPFIDVVSDRIFVINIQKTARLQAAVTTSPVYSYYFTYRGAHSWSEDRGHTTENLGAAHGDDAAYAVRMEGVDTTTNKEDRKMVKFMVDLLTSYAKTGKPEVGIEWSTVPKNLRKPFVFLQIDGPNSVSIGSGVSANTEFWDSLPIIENEKMFLEKKDEL